jgi:hypothetical protein
VLVPGFARGTPASASAYILPKAHVMKSWLLHTYLHFEHSEQVLDAATDTCALLP